MNARLCGVLGRHQISKSALARELGIARSTMMLWLSTPILKPAQQAAIERTLERKGIPIAGLWQNEETPMTRKTDGQTNEMQVTQTEARPALRLVKVEDDAAAAAEATPVLEPRAPEPNQEQIMTVTKQFLYPEDLKHFGLREDPFDLSQMMWMGGRQQWLFTRMHKIAVQRLEIVALVGEVGAGKSTLLRKLYDMAAHDRRVELITPRTIDRTGMSEGGIAMAICRTLDPDGAIPGSLEARSERVRVLLDQAMVDNIQPVLVIDEAHDLPIEAMIAIKRFWDSADVYQRMGAILVGQGRSQLSRASDQTGMRDLGQRFVRDRRIRELAQRTKVFYMEPYTAEDAKGYITHRLKAVEGPLDLFTDGAVAALVQNSAMAYPLAINNIAVLAMQKARIGGQVHVEAGHVIHAIKTWTV